MSKKRQMSAIQMFETIVSNLHGQRQVYRFFDRVAACSTGTAINKPNMMAFLAKYPQYHEKLNPGGKPNATNNNES